MFQNNDTIAAISTAIGESAIGVIRISGPSTKNVISSIFQATTAKNNQSGTHVGWIIDPNDGNKVDNVVVINSEAPKTYTGEDLAEIHCHGGQIILSGILKILLGQGARLAEKGEFTKRAFLNGKIDLIQAESVIDAIRAKTELGAKAAINRLSGASSKQVSKIIDELSILLAEMEASIDFPDEISEPKNTAIKPKIDNILKVIEDDISSAENGIAINDGIKVAIIGKPNVGKSSILNMLLNMDRAIVTDIPGTTTDSIEGLLDIKGFPFIFIDTAGIRSAKNLIEEMGIKRTKEAIEKADVIIAVFDISGPFTEGDSSIMAEIGNGRKLIAVLNKSDKPHVFDEANIRQISVKVLASAITPGGVDALKKALVEIAMPGGFDIERSAGFSNLRQIEELRGAKGALLHALRSLDDGMPLDIVTIDIKDAVESLSRLSGERVSHDIIERVFESFCVGK